MTLAVSIAQSGANNVTMRNRIINGGMMIDQRNNGASVTPTNGQYTLDRWKAFGSAASKYTVQQTPSATETGYVTRVTAGFTNYLACTSSSAYSVTSTDYFLLRQLIEGYNTSDLAWGTSGAKAITLSFWVYSSLTGTFGGSFQNDAQDTTYIFSYSIPTANTWTQVSVTIAGPTSGTWLKTNGAGIYVNFGIGVGSTLSGAAGSWLSGNYFSVTGATSVVGTSGATFYITGVQLEAGTTATPFEQRLIGTEVALCQRYFWNVIPANGTGCYVGGVNTAGSTATGLVSVPYPVTMRTAPSLSTTGSTIYVDNFSLAGSAPVANISLNMSTANVARVYFTNVTVSGGSYSLSQAFNTIVGYGGSTGGLLFSAEL